MRLVHFDRCLVEFRNCFTLLLRCCLRSHIDHGTALVTGELDRGLPACVVLSIGVIIKKVLAMSYKLISVAKLTAQVIYFSLLNLSQKFQINSIKTFKNSFKILTLSASNLQTSTFSC